MATLDEAPGVSRDAVTGAIDRNDFCRMVEWEIGRARQSGSPTSFVSIDLDRFGDLQGSLGSDGCEALLKILADLIRSQTRDGDVLARGQGDQFYLLLPDAPPDRSLMIVEDLRRLLSRSTIKVPVEGGRKSVQIAFSAGIASFPKDGGSREELARKAEAALFRAKVGGRNRVHLASDERSVLKSNYYLRSQLDRLAILARTLDRTEASLLREALDDLFVKFEGPLKGHHPPSGT